MADFSAPLINYSFPGLVNKELLYFGVEEDRQPRITHRHDTTEARNLWTLAGWVVRYRFTQVVRTVFTNPASYSDYERTPPMTLSAALSMAAAVSMLSLPDAIGASAGTSDYPNLTNAAVPDWEITSHEIALTESGLYEVKFVLQAWTTEEWDWGAFTKTKHKTVDELSSPAEEAP